MSAPMNRHARRTAASQARRPDARTRTRVEDFRVPAGQVALTFDIAGRDPSTVSVNADALADLLGGIDVLVAGMSWQAVLHLLASAIKAADAGDARAWDVAPLGFWLATHHPQGGAEMAARLSDAIANGEPAHITMLARRPSGVFFALADRFVDLDRVAGIAAQAGNTATVIVVAEPRRSRQGGTA